MYPARFQPTTKLFPIQMETPPPGAADTDYFQQCKYIHEVELVNMRLQMRILETHLETKDRLLRNLEDIIDEQEGRIANMEEFIQGHIHCDHGPGYKKDNRMLHGISVLSLDFGALSEENMRLKQALTQAARQSASIAETDEDYESEASEGCAARKEKDYKEIARQMQQNNQLARLKRYAEELQAEKNELRSLAMDTKEAVAVCLGEVRLLLESKTADFFKVLLGRYKAEMEKRKHLHNQLVEMNGNIRVFYRLRPKLTVDSPSAISVDKLDEAVINVEAAGSTGPKKSAGADKVISPFATQEQIFQDVSPIVTSCMDGYNVCIFAYGHTGSGKTHTMEGPESNPGINQRAITQLFESAKNGDITYTISVSMLEIYNEKLKDLLNPSSGTPLALRKSEDGQLVISGLEEKVVESAAHVREVLQQGKKNKSVAATDANAESSRSHVVVRVKVEAKNHITEKLTTGRLNLVDLAGSERVSQTNATGQLLKEAQAINKSLSELGNVVLALRQNQKHVPFRNCMLTRILEDSLNGDSKTLVIVHLSPDSSHVSDSLASITFAEKIGRVVTGRGLGRGDAVRKSLTHVRRPSDLTASPKK